MQSLIDQLEQLDLPHLRAGDLRWMYSTGKGQITGSGRDKRHLPHRDSDPYWRHRTVCLDQGGRVHCGAGWVAGRTGTLTPVCAQLWCKPVCQADGPR